MVQVKQIPRGYDTRSYHFILLVRIDTLVDYRTSPLACGDQHGHPLSLFSKLITVFFAFWRQSSLLACRDNRCPPLFIFSKTTRVFCRDFNVSHIFARLQGLLLMYLMPIMLFLLTEFVDRASGRLGGEIARTKLVSLSLLPFYLH